MRLLILESTALKEKAAQALDKAQKAIKPYQKDLEKKVFLCLADAEEEVKRYFEKEGMAEYSFAWPTVETRARVETLLKLLGKELDELVK